jgi:serine/threonine-protein kinase RsbW
MTGTRAHTIGAPGYSNTWSRAPKTAGRARSLVRTALNTWDLGHLTSDASLVISELVGNAFQHSRGRLIRVTVTLPLPGRVRLAVSDTSTDLPEMGKPPANASHGRGLVLVNELSDRWGTDLHRWGKVVWAELQAGGD